MCGTCSTRVEDERSAQNVSWKTRKEEATSGDLDVDGRIILKWIINKQSVMWNGYIRLRIGSKRRILMSTVMKLRVP
jgi:hypothetical protein